MSATVHERAAALFNAARRLEEPARHAAIEAETDVSVREAARRMLEAHERAGGFLATGPGRSARLRAERLWSDAEGPGRALPAAIGRYRVTGLLGEGGMGVVYEAEQEGLGRRVAVKVLRDELSGADRLARFRREGELLGRLQHPGIAAVHEAGLTADGPSGEPRPYIVMEVVRGSSLLDHARERGLDRRARLELLARVADGVQHAHERGVVHRDLKPSNILVDDSGQPKILDFGVARDAQGLSQSASRTVTGDLVGTIPYMSPEQADGASIADARSDVHALGVIGYELLTGRRPLELAGIGIGEALRRLREDDPPRLRSVDRSLRGDLDTIFARALERDPRRRYESAAAFAADIRRHLAHQPIAARPPSALDQLRKLVLRHRGLAAGLGLAMAALAGGLAIATWQAVQAERLRAQEQQQARMATEAAAKARALGARANVAAAAAALEGGDAATARAHLQRVPARLRGWEWRYLDARLDMSVASAPTDEPGLHSFAGSEQDVDAALVVLRPPGRRIVRRLALDAPGAAPGGTQDEILAETIEEGGAASASSLLAATWALHLPADRDAAEVALPDGRTVRLLRPEGVSGTLATCGLQPGSGLAILTQLDAPLYDAWAIVADPLAGRRVASYGPLGHEATSVSFSRDGRRFALAWGWGSMLLGDGESWTGRMRAISREDEVMGVAVAPSGGFTIAGMRNSGLVRLDSEGRETARRRIERDRALEALAISPDGTLVAAGGSAGIVRLLGSDLADERGALRGHAGRLLSIAFASDSRHVLSLAWDGTLRAWDLGLIDDPWTLRGHGSYVYPVAFTPSGERLLSGSWDGSVRAWDPLSARESGAWKPAGEEPGSQVFGLHVVPDGRRVVVALRSGRRLVVDAHTGADSGWRGPVAEASGIDLSRGLLWLAHGATDAPRLMRVDLATLQTVSDEPVSSVVRALSPDGEIAVIESGARCVLVPAGSLRPARETIGTTPAATSLAPAMLTTGVEARGAAVAWTTDGSIAFLADPRGAAEAWDVRSGERLASAPPRAVASLGAAFSPDGARLATADQDGVVRVLDAATLQSVIELRGHSAYAYSVAWSPDGETLASGSGDGTVRLWTTRTVRDLARARSR